MIVFSKYNMVINKNVVFIIFNTLFNSLVTLEKVYYEQIDFNNIGNTRGDVFDFLLENKILVDDLEEKELIEKLDLDAISNKVISITFLPTFAYNFNCFYCYERHNLDAINRQEYDVILDFLRNRDIDFLRIAWFGGEPLLKLNDIIYFMSEVRKMKNIKSLASDITTNGYLLTEDTFRTLVENNVTTYQITIDGNEQNHNKSRMLINGNPTYRKIFDNLKKMHETNLNFELVVRCNLLRNTEIESFLQEYKESFLDDTRISLCLYPVSDWDEEKEHISDCTKSDLIKKYTKKVKNMGIFDSNVKELTESTMFCEYSRYGSFVVLPKSKVCKCTINFKNTIDLGEYLEKFDVYESPKINLRCQKRDCIFYPKCLGYYCLNTDDKESYCHKIIEESKTLLGEFIDESK